MIDKATALTDILRRLEKLPQGHCLDLRTYKRNRSLVIKKIGAGRFLIVQDGYTQASHTVELGKMKKTLKQLFKEEFPRSTKLRLYQLGECDAEERREMKTL